MPDHWPETAFHRRFQATRGDHAIVGFDARLAALAESQHGVVTLAQLERIGLTSSGVHSRAASGRLHRVHRGVYAVGHRLLSREGRWMAAVMACGPGAVLSHRSAAALFGILSSARAAIDVTTPSRAGRSRLGVDVHAGTTLDDEDSTLVHGIPCTTVARTLLDLTRIGDRRTLQRALAEAEALRIFDLHSLDDLFERHRRSAGIAVLRSAVAEFDPGMLLTRSELERRFLELCQRLELPPPEVNAGLELEGGALEVDFLWRTRRLVAEADSRRFHDTAGAFERDRRRDQRLLRAGFRVIRCSWRQVTGGDQQLTRTLLDLVA